MAGFSALEMTPQMKVSVPDSVTFDEGILTL